MQHVVDFFARVSSSADQSFTLFSTDESMKSLELIGDPRSPAGLWQVFSPHFYLIAYVVIHLSVSLVIVDSWLSFPLQLIIGDDALTCGKEE